MQCNAAVLSPVIYRTKDIILLVWARGVMPSAQARAFLPAVMDRSIPVRVGCAAHQVRPLTCLHPRPGGGR